MLFSPVIGTSAEGYGNAKVGERWEDLSPAHRVRSGLPPTIVFHGTADTTTPFKGAQKFHDAMIAAGNRCEVVSVEGAPHTSCSRTPRSTPTRSAPWMHFSPRSDFCLSRRGINRP